MFYYVVLYSFDHERPVFGPFKDEVSCWEAMELDAESEYSDDVENMDCLCTLDKVQVEGKIVLSNIFQDDEPDKTTWIIIEIPDDEEDEN